MKVQSGYVLSCPNFGKKRVSCYDFLYHISLEDFVGLVKFSNGFYVKYYLDANLDYIILNEDAYYKFRNKQFKKYEELYYIYWNSVKYNTLVISEEYMLQLCKYTSTSDINDGFQYTGKHDITPRDKYVILTMISTGWDYHYDQAYQITAIKVDEGSIVDTFMFNVQSVVSYKHILNSMYSIPKDPKSPIKTIQDVVCRLNRFVGNLPIVSCNTYLKNEFIFYHYYNTTGKYMNNSYIDILELANSLPFYFPFCDLVSIMKSLDLPVLGDKSSSLTWCMNMMNCYEVLKFKIKKQVHFNFEYNPFYNRSFIFEGVFKKFPRKDISDLITSLGGIICEKPCNSANFFVLSNDRYYKYLNDKTFSDEVWQQDIVLKNSPMRVISENVMMEIINNYERENGIKL